MGYLADAFAKMKSNLEITQTEQDQATRRHQKLREHIKLVWDLVADFLEGSYVRDTKTKRLKDIDVFIVIDPNGRQGYLRGASPYEVLQALADALRPVYPDVYIDQMACVIPFGPDDEVMSLEVVPAFQRDEGGYEIPDTRTGTWIPTNPKIHQEMTVARNAACGGKFVPLVKMVKGLNRELGEPVRSFLLEVMAHSIVSEQFSDYPHELRWFLADAVEQVHNSWPDPAGVGPDVNTMTACERQQASKALAAALETAERAVYLGDNGQERAAVEAWRELFGWRMPRPT